VRVGALPLAPAFAILICVPLALRAVGPGGSLGRLLTAMYAPAAAAAIVAIVVPEGILAGAIALVWFGYTLVAALHGLSRALSPAGRTPPELCIAAGFAYLAVGGAWFVLWRSGAVVAGFGEHVPLLTAIHFHFAGFASSLLAGLAGRRLRGGAARAFAVAAFFVVLGPAFVALGIAGVSAIEAPAAVAFALGTAAVAALTLTKVAASFRGAARALLAISCFAALVGMTLAVAYAAGNGFGRPILGVDDMARWHGATNAIGYVFCGLLAWNAGAVNN
jgi:YndJ-like protein